LAEILDRFQCQWPNEGVLENPPSEPGSSTETSPPTRRSLLSRLKDWDNQDSWRQFFELYWRLIYDMARKAGLGDAAAQDVVQETVLAAAKQLPNFKYDRAKGSFKGWLMQITRRRISDALRQAYRHPSGTAEAESPVVPDDEVHQFEELWDSEWRSHLADSVLSQVKARCNPVHYQAFELLTVQGWSPMETGKALGLNLAQVYLIRSRLRRMVRDELGRLEAEGV
jgi:RNA polymerase sigma-70 factor (ECF subfamily)